MNTSKKRMRTNDNMETNTKEMGFTQGNDKSYKHYVRFH